MPTSQDERFGQEQPWDACDNNEKESCLKRFLERKMDFNCTFLNRASHKNQLNNFKTKIDFVLFSVKLLNRLTFNYIKLYYGDDFA